MSKKTQREMELETLLMQRDAELNDYRSRLLEASRAIAEYQSRESSIIGALTEAHSSSKRMMDEAMAERDRLLTEAQQSRAEMEAQAQANVEQAQQTANEIVADAQKRAAVIIDNANTEANSIVSKAQSEYDVCKQKIAIMNERLTLTAEDASRRLEEFKSVFNFDAIEPETVEFSAFDSKPVFEEPVFEQPQHSFEQFDKVEETQPVFEESVPVVEKTQPAIEETYAAEQPVTYFFNESTTQTPVQAQAFTEQFFASAPSPFAEPMKEPVPIPKDAENEYYAAQSQNFYHSQNESKVWTVEEVMGQTQPQVQPQSAFASGKEAMDNAFDAELDALINDVLNN